MTDAPTGEPPDEPTDWLPGLVLMRDHEDSWPVYVEAVYALFRQDFYSRPLLFRGARVACRRDPICQGKEAGFWHCTSEGKTEADRTPDLRRCERILWLRAVVEHADTDDRIDVWSNSLRNGVERHSIWFAEEYLIVLEWRRGYWQLITAFTVEQEHRRRKLRNERDQSQKQAGNG